MSLQCIKCGKKLGLLSNYSTKDTPLCFDCNNINAITKGNLSFNNDSAIETNGTIGFWARSKASLIDMVVMLPFIGLPFIILNLQKYPAIALLTFTFLSVSLYPIICIAIWGQTIGKHIVKIEVRKINGDACSWREGLVRNLIVFSVQIVILAIFVAILSNAPDSFYSSGDYGQKIIAYSSATTPFSRIQSFILMVWFLINFIVFLSNAKRRALHDFMAGTIVCSKVVSVNELKP